MISFRFHVVSITAVFLAIAIGVVVGTTYVDGAVVDGLRNRIDTVEKNLDDRQGGERPARGASSGWPARTSTPAPTSRSPTGSPTSPCSWSPPAASTRPPSSARWAGLAGRRRRHARRRLARVVLGPRERRGPRRAGDDHRRRRRTTTTEDLRADAWAAVVDELVGTARGGRPRRRPTPPPVVLEPLADAGFLTVDSLDDDSTALGRPGRHAAAAAARHRCPRRGRARRAGARHRGRRRRRGAGHRRRRRPRRRPGGARAGRGAARLAVAGASSRWSPSSTTPTGPRARSPRSWRSPPAPTGRSGTSATATVPSGSSRRGPRRDRGARGRHRA